jgi:hypothetical protein
MKSKDNTPIDYEAINRAFIHIYDEVFEKSTLEDSWVKESIKDYDFINNYYFEESSKWYEFNSDMLKLSEMFPNVVFCLWGEGEDRDDNWRVVYNDGSAASSHGKIVYAYEPMYEKYFGLND